MLKGMREAYVSKSETRVFLRLRAYQKGYARMVASGYGFIVYRWWHLITQRLELPMKVNEHHLYTYEDIIARFDAAVGKTLGELDTTGLFQGRPRNKGIAGDVVEQSILGYPPDTRQEPDIKIDDVDYEVKTTGLVYEGGKSIVDLASKEPMSITAVSVEVIWRECFATSNFWHKLEHMLLVYYLYNHGLKRKVDDALDYADFELVGYELHEWSETDRTRLESDWQIVRSFVARVHEEGLNPDEEYPKISHELNRRLLYTDTSPKWPNPPRWRLKRATVTGIVKSHFSELEQLPIEVDSIADLEGACANLTHMYRGMTVSEMARRVGYEGDLRGKQVSEALVVRMFGGKATRFSQVDLFEKADIRCRTAVTTKDGRKTEDMKLFRIDLDEIREPRVPWIASSFYEWLTGRLLVPAFEEPSKDAPFSENVFRGFWLIDFDEEIMESSWNVWTEMRRLVKNHQLRDVPVINKNGRQIINANGIPRSAPNWTKSSVSLTFVRGDGRDSTDKPEIVNGIHMYHQWLWVKGSWIASKLVELES